MEPVTRCPVCHGDDLRPYARIEPTSGTLHFAQERCAACGLLIAQPQATDAEARTYYQQIYYRHIWPDHERYWFENTDRLRRAEWPLLLSMWKEWPPPRGGRVLEVGCGYGIMLGLFREEGFQACGCDLNASAVAVCRDHGLDAVVAAAPGLPWRDGEADLACSLQVIEHLSDPVGFVRELVGLVRPGGVVAIATEDGWTSQYQWQRARARLTGRVPRLHTSSDHTFVFQAGHLEILLRQAGCDAVRTQSFSVVPRKESLHWKLFKGACRTVDRLFGHGDYLLAVGRRSIA